MNRLFPFIKKPSSAQRYDLIGGGAIVCIVVALAFMYWGFPEGIKTSEVTPLQEAKLKDLWFSPTGYLVGVKQDNWVVEVITWPEAGGTPSRLLQEDGLQQIVARFAAEWLQQSVSDITSNPPPPYAVARDTSKIALVWRNYLIVKSLSSARYTAIGPLIAPVSGLAFTDNNRLAVLLANGVLRFFDGDNLSPLLNQGTGFNTPAGVWAFDSFVAVASFRDYAAKVFDTKSRVDYSPQDGGYYFKTYRAERFSITDPDAFALSISPAGNLAIAAGREKVIFAEEELIAPGNVRALAVYSEKIESTNQKGVGISGSSSNRVLAAGDFEGIFLLSTEKGKEREQFVSAPAGTRLLAFSPPRLAFADNDRAVLLTIEKSRSINTAGWILLFLFFGYFVMTVSQLVYLIKEKALPREEEETAGEPVSTTPPAEVIVQHAPLPLPEPPEKLIQACAAGECVLYAGAGLSAQSGLATWTPFMQGLVDWAEKNGSIDGTFAHSMREALKLELSDSVADSLINRLRGKRDLLNEYLRETFLKSSAPSAVHQQLNEIRFSAVLTTNFDNLLEQTFAGRESRTYTPADTERLLETLTTDEFYTLKLYGTLERPETVIIAPAQYEDLIKGNTDFSRYMEALFVSRTLLFIGSSLEGIEAYLKGITFSKKNLRTHYALVAVEGNAWRAKIEPLKTRYGIEVLPYSSSAGFPEMLIFIKNLASKAKEEIPKARPESSPTSTRLKRLIMSNIGPFEELELDFNASWNILLGDNGVGKSTILKAIAIAICGEDAKAYAGRLIRGGQDKAEIVLETERNTYTTRLRRKDGDAAEIESVPRRAFETEGWLALGFPPLRTVSWVRPKAAEVQLRRRPIIDDLLPLITGVPDPRIDNLKQWIVNLDYQIKDIKSRGGDATHQENLRDEFFKVITDLTHGFPIKFHEVGVSDQTYKVMIETNDGPLPIEALSQGMASLIGWVGILFQRLHEIYGSSDNPKQRYALVLMDELDAHMHPAWQRTLVRDLEGIFPNVQFIATTHSPLIVGGMLPNQVIRFAREEDAIVRYDVEEEMLVGRADQILTGDLFGLDTTFVMNKDMEKDMEEYHYLLAKGKERGIDEEARYQILRGNLKERVPMPAETPAVRKAQELLDVLLKSEADDKYDAAIQIIRQKAEQLLTEVEKGRKKRQ